MGDMAKRTEGNSGWNKPAAGSRAYSVNDCVNDNFADFVDYWKHSCWWFFDSPEGDQKWGKSWLLGRGKGRVAHDRVFGFGTNARKDCERRQTGIYLIAAERQIGKFHPDRAVALAAAQRSSIRLQWYIAIRTQLSGKKGCFNA